MNPLVALLRGKIWDLFTGKYMGKAGKLLKSKAKALSLIGFVYGKFQEFGVKQGLANFSTVGRMLKLYIQGEYTALPWRTAVALMGGLLYLASPIDIIPDFIPGLGLLDDAWLLVKMFGLAEADLRAFKAWEAARAASDEIVATTPLQSVRAEGVGRL